MPQSRPQVPQKRPSPRIGCVPPSRSGALAPSYLESRARRNPMPVIDLKPNSIVRGSILPEPVKVISIIQLGDSVKLIGEGLTTGKVHQPILTAEQIATLEISPEKQPFDGDPSRFRLGIEAMRLGLA